MDWSSFLLGLLTFPVLISGLLALRLLLELVLVRLQRRARGLVRNTVAEPTGRASS